jgi:uncharacterized protein YfbU (UPF0304 family)
MVIKTVSQIKRRGQEKGILKRTATSRIVCSYSVPYRALQMNVTDLKLTFVLVIIHEVHRYPTFSQFRNNFESPLLMFCTHSALYHRNINLWISSCKK